MPAGNYAAGLGARGNALAARATRAFGTTPRPLVLVLAAFLAINFARVHELVPHLAVLRLGKLIGLPLVILAIRRLPRAQLRAALRTGPARSMLFIGFMMLASVPLSIWIGNSVGYIRGVGAISYVMFVTTASVLVDRAAIPTVLAVEALGVGADALRMFLPNAPVIIESSGVPRALFGYTYDPNDTAALFLVTVPIALHLGGRPGAGWRRWVWYALALLMVVAMVRTGSRGGLIGLGAMVATLVLLAPPRQRARLLGAGVAAVVTFGIAVSSNPVLNERFGSLFSSSTRENDYNYTETNGRIALWKRGVHYMITHPVTGVGINNFTIAEFQIGSELKRQQGIIDRHMLTAHNSLVQIGAELGVPGLIAYLAVVFSGAWGLWGVRRRAIAAARAGLAHAEEEIALASTAITALVGVFVGGLFLSLAYSPMTLFTFALCVAVIAGASPALQPVGAPSMPTAPVRRLGRRGGLMPGRADWASSARGR